MVDIILLIVISIGDTVVTLKDINSLSHTRNFKLMANLKLMASPKHMLNLPPLVSLQPIINLQPTVNLRPTVNHPPIVNLKLMPNRRPILKRLHLQHLQISNDLYMHDV